MVRLLYIGFLYNFFTVMVKLQDQIFVCSSCGLAWSTRSGSVLMMLHLTVRQASKELTLMVAVHHDQNSNPGFHVW